MAVKMTVRVGFRSSGDRWFAIEPKVYDRCRSSIYLSVGLRCSGDGSGSGGPVQVFSAEKKNALWRER
ncbi:unnamed protein product [Camellia sinensis]